MTSHIFAQHFFDELKDEVVVNDNRTGDIIIKGRLFQQDLTDLNEYIDTELAGFLRKSSEEDYWQFSGDGYALWADGTFAQVSKYLRKEWKPQPQKEKQSMISPLLHPHAMRHQCHTGQCKHNYQNRCRKKQRKHGVVPRELR